MKSSSLVLALVLNLIVIESFGQFFNLNAPTITGQRPTPLITEKNTAITIAFQNLRVTDSDVFMPAYPQGYTLTVFPGDNYTLGNKTVTPSTGFVGPLTVRVQVNDGKFDSNIFNLKIDVTNISPVITDHQTLSMQERASLTLLLTHFTVDDDDNKYPEDFTLTVYDRANYSVEGNTITVNQGFTGNLKVQVSVNDGHDESAKFEITIQVKPNVAPEIQGQNPNPLKTAQGKEISPGLDNLTVKDTDNAYPTGFSLKLFPGNNYTIVGNAVKPDNAFVGTLKVPVTVNDGLDDSKKFELKIEVSKNTAPRIDGQKELITKEDQSITVSLTDLIVTDPDNSYPHDFILKIPQGSTDTYTVAGNKITPVLNYHGAITIQIRVNDGSDDSPLYSLRITVSSVNDNPVITGQEQITIRANRSTPLDVTRLKINDPDIPSATFTLKILPGTNYTGVENVVTPSENVVGTLTVRVVVNDGFADSPPYNLRVIIEPAGSNPLITGQQPLAVDEDKSIALTLDDLYVTDDDDEFPTGFKLKILADTVGNYTYQNLTITPKANFNRLLTVYVTVNDGEEDSKVFPLKIYVIPVNDAPQITQLEETSLIYEPGSAESYITNTFKGVDIDNAYLSFAEVGIVDSTFDPLHDELVFQDTELLRGIYDPSKGILSLIGSASIEQYDSAIRSIKYNYKLTIDENGNQSEVIPGAKHIYFSLSDGQFFSERQARPVMIESIAQLDIPNAFTPNGDLVNPTWRVRPLTPSSRFDKAVVKVYNNKGLVVFEGKGFTNSWDGTFKGDVLPTGTYYYSIDLNLSYTKKTYKGTVTILR